ncbi:unnamed protein product, partial [Adineta steineri]
MKTSTISLLIYRTILCILLSASVVQLCDLGYYIPSDDTSTQCVVCTAGYFCAADTKTPDSTIRIACQAGTYQPYIGGTSAEDCLPCPIGTANENVGETSCPKCTSGTYSDTSGAFECTKCTRGTYLLGEGATSSQSCKKCPHGYPCTRFA